MVGFAALATLFCYIDWGMSLPQWADLAMYLQTVILLLRDEGLDSCPQMAWTIYHGTVAGIVSPPEELMLNCGLSFGFTAVRVKHFRSERAPFRETVTFLD